MSQRNHIRRGFSLIELVIVVVIIGIIAAIAIPRLSRGAQGAGDSALSANLSVLRSAIDLYAAEHGGTYPAFATFSDQLTKYSDATGATSDTKGSGIIYGPYLRKVPVLPVGPQTIRNNTVVDGSSSMTATGANGGWIYSATTGEIKANTTTDADVSTKLYNTY